MLSVRWGRSASLALWWWLFFTSFKELRWTLICPGGHCQLGDLYSHGFAQRKDLCVSSVLIVCIISVVSIPVIYKIKASFLKVWLLLAGVSIHWWKIICCNSHYISSHDLQEWCWLFLVCFLPIKVVSRTGLEVFILNYSYKKLFQCAIFTYCDLATWPQCFYSNIDASPKSPHGGINPFSRIWEVFRCFHYCNV